MAEIPLGTRINRRRVGELLRSQKVLDRLVVRAERIAEAAGPGYAVERWVGVHRARATVITRTFDAMRDSATNHSLQKAIDAGRGR